MVNPSKILTVSYGTFSCTLEGFEQPFSTMQAIAEYFRDLAAEDRYFGAEPPTPDAEMLHKIAEREIKRRVDASVQENGIILRPHQAAALAAEAAPSPTPSPTLSPAPVAPTAVSAAALETARAPQQPVAAPAVQPQAAPHDTGPSATDRLERIRAAVAKAPSRPGPEPVARHPVPDPVAAAAQAPAAFVPAPAPPMPVADAPQAPEEPEPAPAPEPAGDVPDLDSGRELDDQLGADLMDDADAADDVENLFDTDPQPEPRPEPRPDPQPVAASESGMAAPEAPETAAPDTAVADPERKAASAALPEDLPSLDAIRASVRAALGTTGLDRSAEAELVEELADVEREAVAMRAADRRPRADLTAEHDDSDVARLMAKTDSALKGAESQRRRATFEHLRAAVTTTRAEEEVAGPRRPEVAEAREIARFRQDLEDAPPPAPAHKPDEAVSTQPPIAEEPAAQDAPAAAAPEPEAHAPAPAPAPQATPERQPDPEPQPDPQAEPATPPLDAQPQRSTPDSAADLPDELTDEGDLAPAAPPRGGMSRAGAVAAVPTRPQRSGSGSRPRPQGGQTPLVLVSEQRIDHPADATPIRPRRVSAATARPAAPPPAQAGFQEFAAGVGASGLDDLIEAAAAYLTHVEDAPAFTRPQLMALVATTPGGADVSREDSSRTLGVLLREGRVARGERGSYTLGAASRLAERARAMAT